MWLTTLVIVLTLSDTLALSGSLLPVDRTIAETKDSFPIEGDGNDSRQGTIGVPCWSVDFGRTQKITFTREDFRRHPTIKILFSPCPSNYSRGHPYFTDEFVTSLRLTDNATEDEWISYKEGAVDQGRSVFTDLLAAVSLGKNQRYAAVYPGQHGTSTNSSVHPSTGAKLEYSRVFSNNTDEASAPSSNDIVLELQYMMMLGIKKLAAWEAAVRFISNSSLPLVYCASLEALVHSNICSTSSAEVWPISCPATSAVYSFSEAVAGNQLRIAIDELLPAPDLQPEPVPSSVAASDSNNGYQTICIAVGVSAGLLIVLLVVTAHIRGQRNGKTPERKPRRSTYGTLATDAGSNGFGLCCSEKGNLSWGPDTLQGGSNKSTDPPPSYLMACQSL